MKHICHIKMRAVFWVTLGIVFLASAPVMAGAKDMGCSPTVANPCTGGSTGGGSGGGVYSAPSYDYGAAQRAREAEAERQRQQAEAERIERERRAEEKRQKDAAFIRDRDAAASTLKGSSGGALNQLKGLAGTDNSGLKGSGFDTGSQLKSAPAPVVDNRSEPAGLGGKSKSRDKSPASKPTPSGDAKVVDARKVPSGLPKGLDNAIAKAYANAPHGVSDRVRKGFQAVMERDWKVAKAWFQDALNRDPTNAGLKRLVALTDTSQKPSKQPATVDARNEPAGLGGRLNSSSAGAPQNKITPVTITGGELQLPGPDDMYLTFPGLKAVEDKEALDYLFGLDPYPSALKSGKTK